MDVFERLTGGQVRERLRAAIAEAGGQRTWAKAFGLSETMVCDVLKGRREPGPRVLEPLGLLRLEHAYAANPLGAAQQEARA